MSGIESGGGEISSSSEVSEAPVAETGGEASEATQEAAVEEAGESGGFEDTADVTEAPEDSMEEIEDEDPDEENDDSQEVGFSEGDGPENLDSPDSLDETDYDDYEDSLTDTDENSVGFDDFEDDSDWENDEEIDDTEIETDDGDTDDSEIETDAIDEVDDAEAAEDTEEEEAGEDTADEDFDDQNSEGDLSEIEDYSDGEATEDDFDDAESADETDADDTDDNYDDVDSNTETNTDDIDNIIDDTEDSTDEDYEENDLEDLDDEEDQEEFEDYSDEEVQEGIDEEEDNTDIDGDSNPEDSDVENADESTEDVDGEVTDENSEASDVDIEVDNSEDNDYVEDETPDNANLEDEDENPEDADVDAEDDNIEDTDAEAEDNDTEIEADGEVVDDTEAEEIGDDVVDENLDDQDSEVASEDAFDDTESTAEADADGLEDNYDDADSNAETDIDDIDDSTDDIDDSADDMEGSTEEDFAEDDLEELDDEEDPEELEDYSDEEDQEDIDGEEDNTDVDSEDSLDDSDAENDEETPEDVVAENENPEETDTNADVEDENPEETDTDVDVEDENPEETDEADTGDKNLEEAYADAEEEGSEDIDTEAEDEPTEEDSTETENENPETSDTDTEDEDLTDVDAVDENSEDAETDVEDVEADEDDASDDQYTEDSEDPGEFEDYSDEDTSEDAAETGEISDDVDTDENPDDNEEDDSTEGEDDYNEEEDPYYIALSNMTDYMNEHNYGREDYAEYSQDPEWQKLNGELQQASEARENADTPSETEESLADAELPENCVMLNASDIDMTYAQGMDSDQFWDHHGNTKEDYMRVAEKIPDVQEAFNSGKSLEEIKQDPELKDTADAYFDPENMIKVEQQPDGSYSFIDDGRHRVAAAQELGYEIPVEVTNMPEDVNSSYADGNVEIKSEEAANPDDITTGADISDETRESLEAFEQNNWDNLSQVEKEQAVEKLRDNIAEDLQLDNKPDVAYYNKEDSGDYGGYAASTNTIYINRYNMGDAAETADTIAHESRHCWQHERAENPQTEQDYQFKENFDDYTRPEENFEEYLNQPVEKDACEYAEAVKNQIPDNSQQQDNPVESESETRETDYNEANPRAPPETDYQSKAVTELPSDFESKCEAENYKKLSEIGKEAYNSGKGREVGEDNLYKELSFTEKEDLSNKGKDLINSIPKEERGNFRVPEPEKIKGVNSEGRIIEAWKPNTDGAVEGSRHMEVPQKGQIIDRIGGENGNYFSPMGEDGQPATLKERAIGDYLPEDNIAENTSYHAYEIQQDFTKENFQRAIENSDLSPTEKSNMMSDLEDYYADCADTTAETHFGDAYAENEETADGVKTGTIAPMFQENDGGATQYITLFNASQLQKIGMIKEI